MAELYGLIGKKLSHSFSKTFFTEKFEKEKLADHEYQLFELEDIAQLPDLISAHPTLKGLNVTIPYKEVVQPYMHKIDKTAHEIGAINVIKVENGKLYGYNSDFYGFRTSLIQWLDSSPLELKALVLGTGGASKAVIAALKDLSIPFQLVSRNPENGQRSYDELQEDPELISATKLIINTTPLGMHPNTDTAPALDYDQITSSHYLYDLVYNPEKTNFLELGAQKGAKTKNGLEMLYLQAEKSWQLWKRLS